MRTIYQFISDSYEKNKESDAIILPHHEQGETETKYCNVSYTQLIADSITVSNKLTNSGLVKGDVVSIVAINGYSILSTFFGVTFGKFIAAPLNSTYTVEEFKFYLEDMGAKLVFIQSGLKAAVDAANELGIKVWELKELPNYETHKMTYSLDGQVIGNDQSVTSIPLESQPQENDVALFLHTSGTTSKPKGVPLRHKNIAVSSSNIATTFHLSPQHRSMVVMPLFHVHGLIGVTMSTFFAGGSLVVPLRFSASTFWSDVKQFNVNWYSAVPTIHQILLSMEKNETASPHKGLLHFIRSCSSSLAPTLFESLENCFGCPVVESYGMTEACHQMSSNLLPIDGKRIPGSVGKGTNVQVGTANDNGDLLKQGEVGEICIKGDNVFDGYHNNPTATAENFTKDGWFLTGDIGSIDEDGFITLKGRKKEIINRGGEKISPLEVDNVLLENESIAEAVCFGVPDTKYGEEIWAAVIPKPSCPELTEEDVKKFLATKIVGFKIPKKIFVTQHFPKTSTGKIQRRNISSYFLNLK
ncbi:AMP-dependent synthetase and ligase domain-containing protein [Cavenderia fasciculata]|uniref:AMP-dependent synthetase and ligase domain-containing protein n=1 Tax=Cavenderia fasciculata TaxID=261658 RepID=F4PJQ4_CACFS|nr:AMP-dependent synthetase and ligase domain-containing protein [Cavenderia fasciculata]EGG23828.1 AMP-dependent synthetase and ligase domain-containing protein [Cavenderia fasciculata]|eukprot:XP_004361679.1 AMP-dependent synthetase and ligase domain-containing protein [Cavenderia fasciculata]